MTLKKEKVLEIINSGSDEYEVNWSSYMRMLWLEDKKSGEKFSAFIDGYCGDAIYFPVGDEIQFTKISA
jgi:hypothetical protein